MTRFGEVALAFASALVNGDFTRAHSFLAPRLREQLPPNILRDEFYGMFRPYAAGEPKRLHYDEEFSMDDWPAKQPGDVGCAYVGIEGDDFVEAVSVTVSDIGGALVIRKVDWGRP